MFRFIKISNVNILLGRWKPVSSTEKKILDRKVYLANYDNCYICQYTNKEKDKANNKIS